MKQKGGRRADLGPHRKHPVAVKRLSTRFRSTVKSKAKSHRTPKAAAVRLRVFKTQAAASAPSSYEEALVRKIIDPYGDARKEKLSNLSVMLAGTISGMTPSMSAVQFRAGMRIGKLVFGAYTHSGDSKYLGNPPLAILDFFEKAGYHYVIYNNVISGFNVIIYDAGKAMVGAKIHSFEAGVLSGFFSSVAKRPILLEEEGCSADGAGYCSFISSGGWNASPTKPEETLFGMASCVANRILSGTETDNISGAYHSLIWNALLEPEYSTPINRIINRYGEMVYAALHPNGLRLGEDSIFKRLEDAVRLLNFGRLKVNGRHPLSATIRFDGPLSRKGFVDLSLSFVQGFVKGSGNDSEMLVKEIHTKGGYAIQLNEQYSGKQKPKKS